MNQLTFAFITPSYAPDFHRCQLLCWSIKKFVTFPVQHYIIVDRKDLCLFQQLADSHTQILVKEDILPTWIVRVPALSKKNLWLNLKGYKSGNWLIRGWLIQQVIKLAVAKYTHQDVLVFIDSDVAFIDRFDVRSLVEGDRVRLFRVDHVTNLDNPVGQRWKSATKNLLNLPPAQPCYDFYVNQLITWRRDNLIRLYEHLEHRFQAPWLEVILRMKDLSEYVLYGIFINYVLGDSAGHYDDHLQKICWCYWEPRPMTHPELQSFFQVAQSSNHAAVMISAKSGMDLSIEEFQTLLAQRRSSLALEPDSVYHSG
jgi:hypothetical protein